MHFLRKISSNIYIKYILTTLSLTSIALLTLPLVPELKYHLYNKVEKEIPDYPISYPSIFEESEKRFITDGNRLFIPKINVETKILEGNSEDILAIEEGVWREPETSNTPIQGNMVLAGHRFQYLPPNQTTFYNLDKLSLNDKIKIYWEGKEYNYIITNIFEVNPDELWIKSQENENGTITLYTCTPIYTSEKRLVVKGKLEQD